MTASPNVPPTAGRSGTEAAAKAAIADFEAGLSDRDRLVLTERIYALHPRTQSEVAELLGSSRERVTQIDRSLRRRLASVVGTTPPLAEVSTAIHRATAPIADAVRLVADVPIAGALVGVDDAPCWRVVARASGLRTTEDWIIRGTLRAVAELTKTVADGAADTGGLVPVDAVAAGLSLTPASGARWLRRTGYAVLGDHAIAMTSSTGDVVAAVLGESGAPLTFDEIVDAMRPIPRAQASIRNAITSDARIVKTDRTRYGLAEWGLRRYEPVHLQIDTILSDHDGAAPIDDVIATIQGRHDVSDTTIRAYAGAGEFQIRDGIVTRRERPHRPRRTPGRTRGLYREDDVVHWSTRITPAQCRGTGFNIPSALAGLLGIGPGSPVTLETALGTQAFTWASVQARSGSIKRFIDELELEPGAPVFLDFGPHTFAIRRAEHATASSAADILTRIGRRPARLTRTRLIQVLAESLWLPSKSGIDEVVDLLGRRRETDLADRVAAALR